MFSLFCFPAHDLQVAILVKYVYLHYMFVSYSLWKKQIISLSELEILTQESASFFSKVPESKYSLAWCRCWFLVWSRKSKAISLSCAESVSPHSPTTEVSWASSRHGSFWVVGFRKWCLISQNKSRCYRSSSRLGPALAPWHLRRISLTEGHRKATPRFKESGNRPSTWGRVAYPYRGTEPMTAFYLSISHQFNLTRQLVSSWRLTNAFWANICIQLKSWTHAWTHACWSL